MVINLSDSIPDDKKNKLVGAIFAITGTALLLVFSIIGIKSLVSGLTLKNNCTETVNATLTDIESELNTSKDDYGNKISYYSYFPIYSFSYNSQEYSCKSYSGSSTNSYEIGSTIILHINPKDPTQFYADSDSLGIVFGLVFIGAALVILTTGLLIVRGVYNSTRKNRLNTKKKEENKINQNQTSDSDKTANIMIVSFFIGAVFCLVGLTIFGIFTIKDGSKKDKACTETVTATVVNLEESLHTSESKSGRTKYEYYYRPIYEYTYNSEIYTVDSSTSYGKSSAPGIGSTISLRIDPQNPTTYLDLSNGLETHYLRNGIILICSGVLACIVFSGVSIIIIKFFKPLSKTQITEK